MPFTKGKMILLVTRSLSTGIHVAHSIYPKKTGFLYQHKCQFPWCIYYIVSGVWMEGWGATLENFWIVGNWFQDHVWGQSGVRTSRRVGGAARNKFVAFIRPHLVDSGIPEKNFYFLFLRKVKERDETTNKSGIGDSISLSWKLISFYTINSQVDNFFA